MCVVGGWVGGCVRSKPITVTIDKVIQQRYFLRTSYLESTSSNFLEGGTNTHIVRKMQYNITS